jgi:hypothetical protein
MCVAAMSDNSKLDMTQTRYDPKIRNTKDSSSMGQIIIYINVYTYTHKYMLFTHIYYIDGVIKIYIHLLCKHIVRSLAFLGQSEGPKASTETRSPDL